MSHIFDSSLVVNLIRLLPYDDKLNLLGGLHVSLTIHSINCILSLFFRAQSLPLGAMDRFVDLWLWHFLIIRKACADPRGRPAVQTHLENHKWPFVFLEIQVRTPIDKQLDPMVQLLFDGDQYGLLSYQFMTKTLSKNYRFDQSSHPGENF